MFPVARSAGVWGGRVGESRREEEGRRKKRRGRERRRKREEERRGRLNLCTRNSYTNELQSCKISTTVKRTTQAISLLARSSTSRGTTPASTTAWIRSVLPSVR